MAFTYKKLFKLLIDRDMKKKDLCKLANISTTSVTKLVNDQNVNTEILEKICDALQCDISDIVEVIHPNTEQKETGRKTKKLCVRPVYMLQKSPLHDAMGCVIYSSSSVAASISSMRSIHSRSSFSSSFSFF